jgi:hypothetical protein
MHCFCSSICIYMYGLCVYKCTLVYKCMHEYVCMYVCITDMHMQTHAHMRILSQIYVLIPDLFGLLYVRKALCIYKA